jgi:YVTN family beta-propeller protein
MIFNTAKTRLYVVNSNADSVSVIDTAADREIERINVRLAEKALPGSSPESLALSADEKTLFVANAHSNAVAVVALAQRGEEKSKLNGFIPTGQYPAALAVVGQNLFPAWKTLPWSSIIRAARPTRRTTGFRLYVVGDRGGNIAAR